MPKRYVSLWFRYLLTDRHAIRNPDYKGKTFVFAEAQRGRKVITALSAAAGQQGITGGMTVADARAAVQDLIVLDGQPGLNERLLKHLATWCLRYTPLVAVDPPDGLLLDATGCTALRGGERRWLKELTDRLKTLGYDVRPAMADTIGCAWGVARCARSGLIVAPGAHRNAMMPLPPSALRLPADMLTRLHNLGLFTIGTFIHMPAAVLRRRFGKAIVLRIMQALGQEEEFLLPMKEPVPYSERLACLEPVKTRQAIATALCSLLDATCKRLYEEGKGLRSATLTYYRIDGKHGVIGIGTNHASHRSGHLFKLFSLKLDQVAPGPGIELLVLDVLKLEPISKEQASLWAEKSGADSQEVAELLDKIAGRIGRGYTHLYLPKESYWPERKAAAEADIRKKLATEWRTDMPLPFQVVDPPEPVEAMALTPDYAPKMFVYRGKRHTIIAADGPERIEREWWEDGGGHRDYYMVEDENGKRYWLFWSGHSGLHDTQHWFIHGFFA